jgi:hypothetical protein
MRLPGGKDEDSVLRRSINSPRHRIAFSEDLLGVRSFGSRSRDGIILRLRIVVRVPNTDSAFDCANGVQPMISKNFSPLGQRFYVAGALLILFGFGLHFDDMRRVGFTIYDDRMADLDVPNIRAGGLPEYLQESGHLAKGQARIGFLFTYSLLLGPYFFEEPVRSVIITIIQLLTYVLICLFLSYYLGKPTAILALAGILCFLSYPGKHYASGASAPILFHVPIALFFLGCCIHLAARQMKITGSMGRIADGVTFLCVLGAACGYEPLFIAFILIEGIICYSLVRGGRRRGAARSIKDVFRSETPIIAALSSYGVAYITFRAFNPSNYGGTTIGREGFRIAAALRAEVLYAVSGLPAANCLFGHGASLLNLDVAQNGSVLRAFINGLGWHEAILAGGMGLVVWLYIQDSNALLAGGSESDNPSPNQRSARLAVSAIVIAFCMQLPLLLTAKYRDAAEYWAPYVPSFFAFVCFCVAVAAFLMAVAGRRLRGRTVLAGVCAGTAIFLCVISRETSALVLAEYERSYASWKLVDLFIKSKSFAGIREGSVIVAPTLWDRDFGDEPDYWSKYILAHSGRQMRVLGTLPPIAEIPRVPGEMNYLEVQASGMSSQPAVLLSDLYIREDLGAAALSAGSVRVFSGQPLNGQALVFQQSAGSAVSSLDTPISGFLEAAPLLSQYDGRAFVSTLSVPDGFVPGSSYLVSDVASLSKDKLAAFHRAPYQTGRDTEGGGKLRVDFGHGFSAFESSGANIWHWSDGESGVGEIIFTNWTTQPVEAVFEACVTTGSAEPSKLILEFRGKSDSVPLAACV